MDKKLLQEQHTYVYEVVDKHGTHTITETSIVDHEEQKNNIGFRYEDQRIQKVSKRGKKS